MHKEKLQKYINSKIPKAYLPKLQFLALNCPINHMRKQTAPMLPVWSGTHDGSQMRLAASRETTKSKHPLHLRVLFYPLMNYTYNSQPECRIFRNF